jgi:hypothetical protein
MENLINMNSVFFGDFYLKYIAGAAEVVALGLK